MWIYEIERLFCKRGAVRGGGLYIGKGGGLGMRAKPGSRRARGAAQTRAQVRLGAIGGGGWQVAPTCRRPRERGKRRGPHWATTDWDERRGGRKGKMRVHLWTLNRRDSSSVGQRRSCWTRDDAHYAEKWGNAGLPVIGPCGGDALGRRLGQHPVVAELACRACGGVWAGPRRTKKEEGFCFFIKGFEQLNSNINLFSTKQK
jgi:hypothetical protein